MKTMVKIMMIMVFACFACTNKNKENAVIQLQQIKGDFPVMECTSTDTIPEIIPLKISFHDVSYTDDKGFLVKEIRCKATFDSLYLSTLQESDVITIYVGESTNAQFSKNNITREEGKFTTIFSLGNTNFVKGKEDVLVIVSRQGKEEKYILRDQITKGTYKNGCVYDLFISDVLFPKPGCIIINVSLLTKGKIDIKERVSFTYRVMGINGKYIQDTASIALYQGSYACMINWEDTLVGLVNISIIDVQIDGKEYQEENLSNNNRSQIANSLQGTGFGDFFVSKMYYTTEPAGINIFIEVGREGFNATYPVSLQKVCLYLEVKHRLYYMYPTQNQLQKETNVFKGLIEKIDPQEEIYVILNGDGNVENKSDMKNNVVKLNIK